jgi:hypothetical protein
MSNVKATHGEKAPTTAVLPPRLLSMHTPTGRRQERRLVTDVHGRERVAIVEPREQLLCFHRRPFLYTMAGVSIWRAAARGVDAVDWERSDDSDLGISNGCPIYVEI